MIYTFMLWANEQDRRKELFSMLEENTDFKDRVKEFIIRKFGDKEFAERIRALLSAREEAARIAMRM